LYYTYLETGSSSVSSVSSVSPLTIQNNCALTPTPQKQEQQDPIVNDLYFYP